MSKNAMEIVGEQGKIKISNDVIMTITQKAVEEVPGIVSFTGGLSKGITEVFAKDSNKGVKIDNEEKQLEINLSVVVTYGSVIPDLIKTLQQRIKDSIENMTEISVERVNVFVQDIQL
ncbi:Asp23/Gls24 family envelope stress response protein [Alkaliphilus crotonatoxidans]